MQSITFRISVCLLPTEVRRLRFRAQRRRYVTANCFVWISFRCLPKKIQKKIIARSTRYTIYHLNNYTVDLPLISPWKRFRCLKSNAHANWICTTLLCTHQSGEWIFVSLKEIVVDTIDMSNGQMIEMRSAWQHIKLCLMTNNHAVSRLNCNRFGYNLFMNFSIELLNGFSFNI